MNINSYLSSENNHKIVLTYTRRLEKATKDIPGRINSDELFVTSDQRFCMNEIASVDPNLLDDIVHQFIINNKLNDTTSKNILQLREIFIEELIRVYINLPGFSDEDEKWEYSHENLPLVSTSITSSIENPWTTQNHSPTNMPEEYERYIKGMTFLNIYEIVRILKPFGPIEPTISLWSQIKNKCGIEIHEVLREVCKDYFSKLSNVNIFVEMTKLINRNFAHIWPLNLKEFPKAGPRVHVLYSGNIILQENRLVLTLNPPKIGNSKRYYRLLTSERFLHLKVKDIDRLDDNQKSRLKSFLLFPLSLAGRIYEFLYAKSGTLYYFATNGLDLPDHISIWQVIDCNLPMKLNKNITSTMFFSRVSLGFSDSTPSIVFEPKEIRYVKDIMINGHCFTDGCAAISWAAMKEVGKILGCHETPSAIQGRFGGAKGVWYIDPRKDFSGNKWIELRESQIKYKHNLDDDFVHLRTLEVLHVTRSPITPGSLNSQFIRVLYNGGVSADIFLKKMKDYIEKVKSEVIGCDDTLSLLTWVTNSSNVMRMRLELLHNHFKEESNDSSMDLGSELYAISGFPDSPYEKSIQMLQAGFTPSTCPYLAKNLKVVLSLVLKSLFTKYRIDIPLSRLLICIADPTKTLQPGEVFIQLDNEAGRDERTGLPFGIIEDEVILARNPCGLPSDIVKVKAVKNTHLCSYYNVVIFPVNVDLSDKSDNVSLASYISGGDYDGDKIFCCWDPDIVKAYRNSPLLPLDPRVKNAFDKNNQTIDDLFSSNQIESKLQEIILDNYFKDLETPRGLYDHWHILQSSEFGISNKESIYLTQMCAQLIDATKQGLTIKPSVQQRDNEIFGKLPIPYWIGKDHNNSKNRSKIKRSNEDNFGIKDVMDYLCSSMEKEMNEINSKEFSVVEMKIGPDPHIYKFWHNEIIRAQQMEEDLYLEDLNLISTYALRLVQNYNRKYAQVFEQQSSNTYSLNEELKCIDYKYIKEFLNTPPVEKYKSSMFKLLKDRRSTIIEDPLSIFELQLKAASLYLSSKKLDGQVCWVIAFRILCNIKSQMLENEQNLFIGGPRSIIDKIWQALTIDKTWLKYNNLNT